ncbi:methylated-DNA--[protein]-cysteine S-methyltransferase [Mariniluteicoccus flavus]
MRPPADSLDNALRARPSAAESRSALARLRARLAAAADTSGDLDVAWRPLDSPLGPLVIAATPRGVVRVAFESEGVDPVLAELAAAVSPKVLQDHRRLDPAARALDAYFAGRPVPDDLDLDLALARGFRRTVLDRLRTIPFGSNRTYAAVAAETDSPRAVRAVGTACARNPVPLVVPCHRVVRSDGAYGAYRGGAEAKAYLLDLERAHS